MTKITQISISPTPEQFVFFSLSLSLSLSLSFPNFYVVKIAIAHKLIQQILAIKYEFLKYASMILYIYLNHV
jgi:hypothetical protein